jgi:hypothetical protein
VIAVHPAEYIVIDEVILHLRVVAGTGADLESGTGEGELVDRLGDGIHRAVYAQIRRGNERYIDERVVDAHVTEGEFVDFVVGKQVRPCVVEEASVQGNVQREIQISFARRSAVRG